MLLPLVQALCSLVLPLQLAQETAESGPDWSRFRGPNGSGVASVGNLPDNFAGSDNLRWRRELGNGYSSPVLFGQRIFLTSFEEQRLFTLCLDRDSGIVLWKREAPRRQAEKLDGRNNPASPSPAVDADVVVVFFPELGLLGFDHLGNELWRHELGPFNNVYGMGASPILAGDVLILACDQAQGSFLLCLDKLTGKLRWRTERPHAKSGHCTPILRMSADGTQELILPGSFSLDAYDLATGRLRWFGGGLCFEMKSVPILFEDLVLVAGYGSPMNQPGNQIQVESFDAVLASNDADGDGLISKQEMPATRAAAWFEFVDLDVDGFLGKADWEYLARALSSQNGLLAFRAPGSEALAANQSVELVWSYRRAVPQLPSPLIYSDVLYLLADGGGLVTTFRPGSGQELAKERMAAAVDTYYASPVAADDKIYLISEHGSVVVLPAGGGLEPLSVTDLGENVYATPALAEGRIYIRTVKALYCFGSE